jgi:uncharacterized membrane protein
MHLPSGPDSSEQRRAAGAPLRALTLRAAAIMLLSAACAITVAAGWHSPVRVVLAIVFLLIIPGLSIAELLEVDDVVYRLTIATGASLAADTAVSLILIYARAFSVGLALAILIALTAAALGMAGARAWRRQSGSLAG